MTNFSDVQSTIALNAPVGSLRKQAAANVATVETVHDIRNILAGIRLLSEMARRELVHGSPASDAVGQILSGCEDASRMCGDLLDGIRTKHVGTAQADLSLVVEQMCPVLRALVSPSELRLELTAGLPLVRTAHGSLRRVVTNLVTNAVRSFGAKPGVVTIRTGQKRMSQVELRATSALAEAFAGLFVYLEVSDNGCGMDEATRLKIFEPYFSTRHAVLGPERGHGLGMSSLLRLVTDNGGAVQVQSQSGVGTTVRAVFPQIDISPKAAAPHRLEPIHRRVKSGTLLLVDDDRTVLLTSKRLLEHQGWKILTAESGASAISVFQEHQGEITAVLLDASMPGMDGADVLRRMRQIDPRVRAIILSGYDEDVLIDRFRGEPTSGYLSKPFSADAVLAKVHEVLAQ